ncbi:MAG TPA: M20/M25/M40 family metallo-hydrolase [Bryobacteraceae bacterium]|nr:M20/M25/M40 family metallo-hydrolase [Bryobacteraceae bacterium]
MRATALSLLVVGACAVIPAQIASQHDGDSPDLGVVQRIEDEAFQNSKVMDTLSWLTDVHGPRLTASPGFDEAATWAVERLSSYGLQNVHREKWGPFGRSWALHAYSLEMLAPRYAVLDATPLAWSGSTPGQVTGDALYAPFEQPQSRLNLAKYQEALEAYEKQWRGKLRGRIVLLSKKSDVDPLTKVLFERYTEQQLAELARAPEPQPREEVDLNHIVIPDDPKEARAYLLSLPENVRDYLYEQRSALIGKRNEFLRGEGAAAVITADHRAHDGLLFAEQSGPYQAKYPVAPPIFVVTAEQYDRLARIAEKHLPVRLRVNLDAAISKDAVDTYNIVGEIPGGAKADEVVMVGAHFDSWHSGTGATDNGAGSAVMIEVMRILKALDLHMDRTVRIALWSGEEEGLLGSKAYVKEHFGDPATMKVTEAQAKLSGYFNLDNGSGRIRGVYLQNNVAMRPVFEHWLAPFRDLGVTTVSPRDTGGTDHLSFDAVGIPGFQFIQDPLDYETVTHHSSMDTYDHAQPADLMQCAAVIASVVYDAATRGSMLPRKPLPKPEPKLPASLPGVSTAAGQP